MGWARVLGIALNQVTIENGSLRQPQQDALGDLNTIMAANGTVEHVFREEAIRHLPSLATYSENDRLPVMGSTGRTAFGPLATELARRMGL